MVTEAQVAAALAEQSGCFEDCACQQGTLLEVRRTVNDRYGFGLAALNLLLLIAVLILK